MENEKETWAGYVGGLILIIIFGTLALVTAGGWDWFAKMLENSAPAWIQAVGSVFAIFVAVGIANKQHTRQIIKEEMAANQITKHRNDILYFSIENIRQTSDYIAKRVCLPENSILLNQYKIMFIESRVGLSQFPILEIQNPELALAVMELNQFLSMSEDRFSFNTTEIEFKLSRVIEKCAKIQTIFWTQKDIQSK